MVKGIWRLASGGGGGGGGGSGVEGRGVWVGVWGRPKEHLEVRVAVSQRDSQRENDSSLTH